MALTTVCDLNHSIFEIFGNITRREMLRLIACEHNYGNQIASILNKSRPAISRHLDVLSNDKYIQESHKTKTYFGRQGAEATMYEIGKHLNLFLSVQPNFIHSHILETNEDGEIISDSFLDAEEEATMYLPPKNLFNDENEAVKSTFGKIFKKVEKINTQIIAFEEQMTKILIEKNKLMQELDEAIRSTKELSYEERVLLRGLTCLGPSCIPNLAEILNEPEITTRERIDHLVTQNWIIKAS